MSSIVTSWPWYDRAAFGFLLFTLLYIPFLIVHIIRKLERIIRLLEIRNDIKNERNVR